MGWLFAKVADNTNPDSLAARMRQRRFRLFRELVSPLDRPVRVLDVGGTPAYWEAMGPQGRSGLEVVMLNRTLVDAPWPGFSAVEGDATDLGRFADHQFDVVFSNSVIEHVGDWSAQRRMAAEIVRVGRRYYVQTPNRFFPIEPHFLVPGFQFFPVALSVALVRRFDLGWYKRIPDANAALEHVLSHQLLSGAQMRELFPGAQLHRERILGLTKSLIAVGGAPGENVRLAARARPPARAAR